MYDMHVDAFFNLTQKYKKPVIAYVPESSGYDSERFFGSVGFPIYKDPERAARAMAALLRYYNMRKK
jgi:acyl-CoA synthetase (NDP forming)